jgi:hypothetical protein
VAQGSKKIGRWAERDRSGWRGRTLHVRCVNSWRHRQRAFRESAQKTENRPPSAENLIDLLSGETLGDAGDSRRNARKSRRKRETPRESSRHRPLTPVAQGSKQTDQLPENRLFECDPRLSQRATAIQPNGNFGVRITKARIIPERISCRARELSSDRDAIGANWVQAAAGVCKLDLESLNSLREYRFRQIRQVRLC